MRRLDPEAIEGPVLVVAPHPDDETLGCGGMIAALSARGQTVHTVFVTDGGASHPRSALWPRPRLCALREAEAAEALALLGAGAQPRSFLRLADAGMPARGEPRHAAALDAFAGIVRSLRPATAFLPWRRDPHCDHRASRELAIEAFAAGGIAPEIFEYAIWLDELGAPCDRPQPGEMERVELSLGDWLSRKQRAIRAHRSQLGEVVSDDPSGFALSCETLHRLVSPLETYWRPCARM